MLWWTVVMKRYYFKYIELELETWNLKTYLIKCEMLSNKDACWTFHYLYIIIFYYWVTLYFKVSLLQCNYAFKYCVILINYMYLLYS